MHPIERLRWVARSGEAGDPLAVVEAAEALAAFADDPASLVTACRRLLERGPGFGPLWWMSSRVLCALDPAAEAYAAATELERDATVVRLALELPDGPVVVASPALRRRLAAAGAEVEVMMSRAAALALIEAQAAGPSGFAVTAGSAALARQARHAGVPVWMVTGVGRVLPVRLYDALLARAGETVEVLLASAVDQVACPDGLHPPAVALARADCPIAPELLHFPG
jgi:hypothetical protein